MLELPDPEIHQQSRPETGTGSTTQDYYNKDDNQVNARIISYLQTEGGREAGWWLSGNEGSLLCSGSNSETGRPG